MTTVISTLAGPIEITVQDEVNAVEYQGIVLEILRKAGVKAERADNGR